jgi:hypothetical protein
LTTGNHSAGDVENEAEKVLSLLDDDIDVESFDSALDELGANPLLMGSLMAAQFVRDALNGNPCPDRHYTARIMQFIAASELTSMADAKRDDVER